MQYAPENEHGVVLLFSHVVTKLQLKIERIQSGFPDCIAYQRTGSKEKRIRIEFEYKSRNFLVHKHRAVDCDWIVCWEHNWPRVPKSLFVLELRKFFGHGFNVWMLMQPPTPPARVLFSQGALAGRDKREATLFWGLRNGFRNRPQVGDLALVHRASPYQFIDSLYRVSQVGASLENSPSFPVILKRVCILPTPLAARQIKRHPLLGENNLFVGISNRRITTYWWCLYEMIARNNPSVVPTLSEFLPERV